jgi:sec-independent protein translocase protein TatB
MFGLTIEKLLVVTVIAAFLIGPTQLPRYAAKLARLVRAVRRFGDDARIRMREELGEEFDELDWKALDPRQYDPRRIIRDALAEPDRPAASARPPGPARPSAGAPASSPPKDGE